MDSHPDAPAAAGGAPRLLAVALAGAVLTGLAATVAAVSDIPENPSLAATGRALMVAVPIAVGLYAWHRRPDERFGHLLVAAGFGWFLTTLAESGDSVLYSVGRVSGWVVEIGLVWLILAFPSGRLTSRLDRTLVLAMAAVVALLYLPTALLAADFPVPAPYTSCDSGCPDNAFFVLGSEPAVVDALFLPLRELLTLAIFLAAIVRLRGRLTEASPLLRRTLAPVVYVAAGRLALVGIGIVARWIDPHAALTEVVALLVALALPALAAAFFIGLLESRLYQADALQKLPLHMGGQLSPARMQTAFAEALRDPSLRVMYWMNGKRDQWVDADGRPAEPPAPESGKHLSEIRDNGRLVAGVVHDDALNEQEDFIRAVGSYALVELENRRLTAKVESSLREVRKSRARLLVAADQERRRLERDLHDGAQQRLVALRIQLELVEDLLQSDPERARAKLHTLGEDVGITLEEIRELAHGVYPSLLADRGLAEALRAVSQKLPVATRLRAADVGRHSSEIESAVYFCCLEAIQNASKHATDASHVDVIVTSDAVLRFEVRDDGCGFNGDSPEGAGITNMRDRLAAVGGELEISSVGGQGTSVVGTVPISAA